MVGSSPLHVFRMSSSGEILPGGTVWARSRQAVGRAAEPPAAFAVDGIIGVGALRLDPARADPDRTFIGRGAAAAQMLRDGDVPSRPARRRLPLLVAALGLDLDLAHA